MPFLAVLLLDFIEHPALIEVLLLDGLPVTANVSEGEQFELVESSRVFFGDRLRTGPIVVLSDDFLAFLAVKMLEVSFGGSFGAVLFHNFIHPGHGWLSEDARRRNHNLKFVL